MIAYIVGRDFRIKGIATTESEKHRIIDDSFVTGASVTCDITVNYSGKFSDLCDAGDFLYIPERDIYSNFFQIISVDVDYINKTAILYGDNNLLWLYSQRARSGEYGHVSNNGQQIVWYLSELTDYAKLPFVIRTNELANEYRTGDTTASTAKEMLDKTAALFGCEICLAFAMENGTVNAYIDIFTERNGHDTGEVLTVGNELTALRKSEDVSAVFTSVYVRGGIKAAKRYTTAADMMNDDELEQTDVCIAAGIAYLVLAGVTTVTNARQMTDPRRVYNLNGTYYRGKASGTNQKQVTGYSVYDGFAVRLTASTIGNDDFVYTPLPAYDEGDYFISSDHLVSRSMWSRFAAPNIGAGLTGYGAEIACHLDDLETVEQDDILAAALNKMTEKDAAITYDCECSKPVQYGAYYTLCVPDESVYISARCIGVEESMTFNTYKPTFGNFVVTNNAFEIMAKNAK